MSLCNTTDIDKIKKELKNCVEVKLPYVFQKKDKIKYITLLDSNEVFNKGGEFVKYGNERIVLSNGASEWSFKTKIRNDSNEVIYQSRIFLEVNSHKCEETDIQELQEIIEAQRKVIDTMSHELHSHQKEIQKYERVIQKLKSMK